ncbi:MAG: hypothetical protein LAT68_00710 [Cyclobacteriaceae bacterium]|nr:hypothetical protein [Cyclobacteriaceae bacterium]MCH8514824.1 hypothetical protein [Cyclobacteriaceae bacterium]
MDELQAQLKKKYGIYLAVIILIAISIYFFLEYGRPGQPAAVEGFQPGMIGPILGIIAIIIGGRMYKAKVNKLVDWENNTEKWEAYKKASFTKWNIILIAIVVNLALWLIGGGDANIRLTVGVLIMLFAMQYPFKTRLMADMQIRPEDEEETSSQAK